MVALCTHKLLNDIWIESDARINLINCSHCTHAFSERKDVRSRNAGSRQAAACVEDADVKARARDACSLTHTHIRYIYIYRKKNGYQEMCVVCGENILNIALHI